MKQKPRAIVIAGPDGAGKTTFARDFLPIDARCPYFVNVDLIADGLGPFKRETSAARRVMQQELQRHFDAQHDFALETTLATRSYVPSIAQWRAAGYRVTLIFLQLDSTEHAIARVSARFLTGGHAIPADRIRRDFAEGFENFKNLYVPQVDAWALYDNAGVWPVLLDCSEKCPVENAQDFDLRLSAGAIQRAAQRVHEMAEFTGTPVIVSRNGVLEQMTSGFEKAGIAVHESRRRYAVD